jgi:hypothetical protein
MFHASTTLHHQHRKFDQPLGERRLVMNTVPFKKKMRLKYLVAKDALSPLGTLGKWFYYMNGGFIITPAAKGAYEGLRWTTHQMEWAARTAREGVKGVWGMTGRPMFTLLTSVYNNLKMNLVDIPVTIGKGIFTIPIAAAKSPFEMAKGVRDGIASIPRNAKDVLKSMWDFDGEKLVESTRKAITQPFTLPAAGVGRGLYGAIAEPVSKTKDVVSTALRSKLQYILSVREAANDVGDGARTFVAAPTVARGEMDEVLAYRAKLREEKKKMEEEEKQALMEEAGLKRPEKQKMAA